MVLIANCVIPLNFIYLTVHFDKIPIIHVVKIAIIQWIVIPQNVATVLLNADIIIPTHVKQAANVLEHFAFKHFKCNFVLRYVTLNTSIIAIIISGLQIINHFHSITPEVFILVIDCIALIHQILPKFSIFRFHFLPFLGLD